MITSKRRARAHSFHGGRTFFEWTVDDANQTPLRSQSTEPDPTPIDTPPPDPLLPVDVPEPRPVEVPEPTPA